jgi:hypothetical protein
MYVNQTETLQDTTSPQFSLSIPYGFKGKDKWLKFCVFADSYDGAFNPDECLGSAFIDTTTLAINGGQLNLHLMQRNGSMVNKGKAMIEVNCDVITEDAVAEEMTSESTAKPMRIAINCVDLRSGGGDDSDASKTMAELYVKRGDGGGGGGGGATFELASTVHAVPFVSGGAGDDAAATAARLQQQRESPDFDESLTCIVDRGDVGAARRTVMKICIVAVNGASEKTTIGQATVSLASLLSAGSAAPAVECALLTAGGDAVNGGRARIRLVRIEQSRVLPDTYI